MAQYYLAKNGQKAGPFTIEQLVQNGLTPESLVFTQGMTAWTKASEVAELASVLKPTPAPQPAPAAPAHNTRLPSHNTRLPSRSISNPISSQLWATMWQLHKWTL